MAEAIDGIPDRTVLDLYQRCETRHHDRATRLRVLAKFISAARRGLEPHERQNFASVARKALAEAIRRVDDRGWRSTKSGCRGCRYWSEAAIRSHLEGKRIFGEHSPECGHLAEHIWRAHEPSFDDIYRILSGGEVIALTKEEQKLVGRADRNQMPQVFANFDGRVSTIYCLSGQRPERVWPSA